LISGKVFGLSDHRITRSRAITRFFLISVISFDQRQGFCLPDDGDSGDLYLRFLCSSVFQVCLPISAIFGNFGISVNSRSALIRVNPR
jgi:hypothetical protein